MSRHYSDNAKWLKWFAPFRQMSISAAYLVPFFLSKGLSQTEVMLLQSVFSLAYLLWEVPSGYVADRFGRAFSIKLSVPLAACALVAYGFSDHFWQFVVWELVLAVANGLISGVDTALLYDSLKADNREDEYVKLSQRVNSFGFASYAIGVPVAVVLVSTLGVQSTIVVDGLLVLSGGYFAWKLTEAPRFNGSQEEKRLSAWHATRQLARNSEVRWLVVLDAVLSLATYLGFWLSAPHLNSVGIPVALFGVILAIRNLFKAWLSHKFHQVKNLQRNLTVYAMLAGLVYLAMASRQIWLLWALLGHDIVHALSGPQLGSRLNRHIDPDYRATMNSVANLVERLAFAVAGPLAGLAVDRFGLQTGLVLIGMTCSAVALTALRQLHRLKTFHERR